MENDDCTDTEQNTATAQTQNNDCTDPEQDQKGPKYCTADLARLIQNVTFTHFSVHLVENLARLVGFLRGLHKIKTRNHD